MYSRYLKNCCHSRNLISILRELDTKNNKILFHAQAIMGSQIAEASKRTSSRFSIESAGTEARSLNPYTIKT